jgi:hypothetical protein
LIANFPRDAQRFRVVTVITAIIITFDRFEKKNESSKLAQRKNADNRRMLTRWNNRPEKEEESANSPLLKKVTLAEEMFRVIPLNVCSQHEGCVQQQQVFLYIHPPAR